MLSSLQRSQANVRKKRYRKRQKEKGLCRNCHLPIYRGSCCYYHDLIEIKRSKEKKKRRIEKGKCVACGKPLAEEEKEYRTCYNCRGRLYPIKIYEITT